MQSFDSVRQTKNGRMYITAIGISRSERMSFEKNFIMSAPERHINDESETHMLIQEEVVEQNEVTLPP